MHNKKSRPYTLFSVVVPLLAVAVVLGLFAYKSKLPSISDESVLSSSSKNSGKNAGKSNSSSAQEHRKKIETVVTDLQNVSKKIKAQGNVTTSTTVDTITDEIESDVEDTAEAIEEIESTPKWKTFLFGTEFKNLGQLRSSLAHSTNTMRKINKEIATLGTTESGSALQAQLTILAQERVRILNLLSDHNSEFSVLGWFNRIFSGYSTPTDDTPETTESTQ